MIFTIPGYTSQRDPQEGTWFIQSLVEIFMNHSHEKELIDLLRMTSDYLSKFTNAYGDKQTCNVEMRHLYKRIYFNPGVALGGTRSRQRRVSGTQTQMSPKATRRRSFSTPPTSPLTETANNQLWKKKRNHFSVKSIFYNCKCFCCLWSLFRYRFLMAII